MSSAGEAGTPARRASEQCAGTVLMVRPHAFGYNAETAASNTFQEPPVAAVAEAPQLARAEFDRLAQALRGEGVNVVVAADSAMPAKPDAVFPNNWLSFHEDGTLVLYPMTHASRRPERRQEVIDAAVQASGFKVRHLLDLSWYEGEGRYLEGTGSLVLDHVHRLAFACVSDRTDPGLVEEWARELDYSPVIFSATNRAGVPLYHTNVCLWIGARVAVVGTEAIAPADRERVLASLRSGDREVVQLGHREVEQFGGNMLELSTWDEALGDAHVVVMSESARRGLGAEAWARISGSTDSVLVAPVPTIERLGGGSVRCMMAEVFGTP